MSDKGFAWVCSAVLATVIGASVGAVLWTAPSLQRPTPRFLLCADQLNEQQSAMIRGARAAADRLGIKLELESSGQSKAALVRNVGNRDSASITGAIVCQTMGHSSFAISAFPETAMVTTCGLDASPGRRLCHIGTGEYAAGRKCGKLVNEIVPEGARVIVVVDSAAEGRGGDRLAGFREGLGLGAWESPANNGAPRVHAIECLEDFGRPELLARNIDAAGRRPDVACVVDLGAPDRGSIVAHAESFAAKGVKVITFDSSPAALAAVEAGHIYAVLADDPFMQGYQAVERLYLLCEGGAMGLPAEGHGSVNVPAKVIRRNTLAEHRLQLALHRPPAT